MAREEQQDFGPCRPITREEVKEALMKMKIGKTVSPDNIPVEIWKSLGEWGVVCLTEFLNVILKTVKMP